MPNVSSWRFTPMLFSSYFSQPSIIFSFSNTNETVLWKRHAEREERSIPQESTFLGKWREYSHHEILTEPSRRWQEPSSHVCGWLAECGMCLAACGCSWQPKLKRSTRIVITCFVFEIEDASIVSRIQSDVQAPYNIFLQTFTVP